MFDFERFVGGRWGYHELLPILPRQMYWKFSGFTVVPSGLDKRMRFKINYFHLLLES